MEDTESSSSRGSEASPSSSSGGERRKRRRQKVEVFQEVVRRLRELNDEEANRPGFEDELWAHFSRLPLRYALDVNVERAEDVLMHKRLLHMAHDPNTRLAFELRLVQVHSISDGNPDETIHSNFRNREDARNFGHTCSFHPSPAFGSSSNFELAYGANNADVQDENSFVSGNLQLFRPSHEITISTNDKPKLLTQLTSLLSEVGLNIQEAHAFSTKDGYSLDVFTVDGWPYEETDRLKNVLAEEIQKIESQSQLKQKLECPGDRFGQHGIKFISNHVDFPTAENDVWEVDVNQLNIENKIATRSNCDLYKGTFFSQDVAIKVLKAEYLNEDVQREFAHEVYMLSKLRHKNIVQFIGACTRPPLLCIVTEFMHGGSVYDLLHKREGVLKLPAIVKIAIDVSRGMSYLHQNNIIHRDLKAANLLIDENNVIKVADFGVARVQVQSGIMTAETGTYRWMAPEVIGHRPYDHKADVFSFGIVLWELLTGKLPYEHLTPLQAALGVVQKGLRPIIPSDTHPVMVDLLKRCWEQDSSLRPEFSEILDMLQHLAEEVGEEERSGPSGKRRNLGGSFQLLD